LVSGFGGQVCEQLLGLDYRIKTLDKKIFTASRKDERVRLLETIPGIGPVTASAGSPRWAIDIYDDCLWSA